MPDKTDSLSGQQCPMCGKKELTLTEAQSEVPFFGRIFMFSMHCSACHYHKADVEAAEQREPARYTFEITGKDDLNVRVIRSSEGTIKIPHVGSLEPGPNAEGFVSNVEGVLQKFKHQIEVLRDTAEDDDDRKKAKNLLKKLQNVLWGSEKLKIIIEDPSGNSAIVSEKAVRQKL
ncbi:MAG: ZPR1 zinc finger domain-containing protein [Candidatus Woesearchaeota archaeon]